MEEFPEDLYEQIKLIFFLAPTPEGKNKIQVLKSDDATELCIVRKVDLAPLGRLGTINYLDEHHIAVTPYQFDDDLQITIPITEIFALPEYFEKFPDILAKYIFRDTEQSEDFPWINSPKK